jgi:splicing suppressor protein 51
VCASLAAVRANGGAITFNATTHADVLSTPIKKPYHKLKERAWLHDRSDADVMKLLVDTYRFRRLEEFNVLHCTEIIELDPESLYYMQHFRDYINDAARKNLLPAQFTEAKIEKCIEYAFDTSNWSNLHNLWATEPEYFHHYRGGSLLEQMTLFAWQVEGPLIPFNGDEEESGDGPYEATFERALQMEIGI